MTAKTYINIKTTRQYIRTRRRLMKNDVVFLTDYNKKGQVVGIEIDAEDAQRQGYIKQDNSMYWVMAGLVVFLLVCVGLWVWSWFW